MVADYLERLNLVLPRMGLMEENGPTHGAGSDAPSTCITTEADLDGADSDVYGANSHARLN